MVEGRPVIKQNYAAGFRRLGRAARLETQDTGQAPQKGDWLAARHGKGIYIYCAYAWYRQLPYAVPGGVRLFANLISR